jgi:ankyrin repeat protein
MLNTLVEKGLDVNAVCKDGDTPVHYAACQGEKECVEALAAAGADLTIKDNDGETPYKVAHKSVKKLIKDLIAKAQGDSGEVEEAADAMAAAKLED